MSPARTDDEAARQARVASWQERRPMPNWPGDPRAWEKEKQQTAELTPLGKKLLGVDQWN